MSKECKNCDKVDECKNFEPIETAFEGIVRKFLKADDMNGVGEDWGWIQANHRRDVTRVRTVVNATLDLATSVTQTKFCDCFARIQDLKETSNEH